VIHLKYSKLELSCLAGNSSFEDMPKLRAFPIFSDIAVKFLSAFSEKLILYKGAVIYPEIVALGFFCRKANLNTLKKQYSDIASISIGRGLSFHITPSNVPINFAYSLITALISGNASIIRVSSKPFVQISIIVQIIKELLDLIEFHELHDYISIVSYDHDHEINNLFSSICDIRLIWGGDQTIDEIRKSKIPAHAYEIVMSDRYSLSIINADKYILHANKEELAIDFYNDTYSFDQNACSSPRMVYWVGKILNINNSQNYFWKHLNDIILKKQYQISPLTIINKFVFSCKVAIELDDTYIINTPNNLINRIKLNNLDHDVSKYSTGGGIFFEYSSRSKKDLTKAVTKKFQTLTYFGFDGGDLNDYLLTNRVSGIDRITPIGNGGKFSFMWDGRDLIREMSRKIYIE